MSLRRHTGFNLRRAAAMLRPSILDKLPAPSAPLEEQYRFAYRLPPQKESSKRRQQQEGGCER